MRQISRIAYPLIVVYLRLKNKVNIFLVSILYDIIIITNRVSIRQNMIGVRKIILNHKNEINRFVLILIN